jgi:hypothetical protein
MDIVVHGTKGGRKIFTPKKLSGLLDVTADGAKTSATGQEAYAIRFTADSAIFSKYKIVRDVRGDKRTGFVGFSLFLSNHKKLSGADIITLLDRVSDEYCRKYIVNNNLDEVKEDWTVFERLASEYETRLKPNNEEALSGSRDDAFIYFKDTDELKRYFDAPFQEEYSDYRQVLFIDKRLESAPENPLNALRHDSNANLTGRIDLENRYYYLSNYDPGKQVSIFVSGRDNTLQACSDRKNNNCIRAHRQVVIKYSKDDRCYFPIEARGTLSNPDSEIYRYLEIRNNQIIIKYDAFNNPTSKTKSVLFEIKDRKGNPVNDAEIQIGTQPWQKVNGYQYEHTFEGEELKEHWTVSVRKDDSFGRNVFTTGNTNGRVDVVMIERNIVTVNVTDWNTGNKLDDFEVWTKLTNGFRKITQIEFVDDQIIDNYTVTIRKDGYEEHKIDNFQPHRQKYIDVKLKKRIINGMQSSNYKVSTGEHGKWKDGNEYFSNCADGSDIKYMIDPYKGYEFIGFQLSNNTLVAQYRKKTPFFKKPAFIAGSIVGIFAIVMVIFYLKNCGGDNEKSNKSEDQLKSEIMAYVKGDSLILEKLKDYRGKCKDSATINTTKNSIDSAVNKRNYIDDKNFAELKKLHYPDGQQKFKDAVEKIDSAKYEYVKTQLGDVSKLSLTQIADSINAILTPKTTVTKQLANTKNNSAKEMQEDKQQPVTSEKTVTSPASQQGSTSVTDEIIQYLKGGDIDEKKLKEYKDVDGINNDIKTSIDLCLKLWSLNGTNNNSYSWMLDQINKHPKYESLKNSKLKDFLELMCDNKKTEDPKYWDRIPGNKPKKKTLNNLKLQK